jgi:hypothetical protein
MATRSAIAVMHGNKAKSIYAHWDGYLAHNGYILNKCYDSVKANKLVSMGDLSSLGADIGEAHEFGRDMTDDMYVDIGGQVSCSKDCTFYIRDRGEENATFKSFNTYDKFRDHYLNCGCEYFYIMKDGVWYYSTYKDATLKLVAEGLANLAESEAEVAY